HAVVELVIVASVDAAQEAAQAMVVVVIGTRSLEVGVFGAATDIVADLGTCIETGPVQRRPGSRGHVSRQCGGGSRHQGDTRYNRGYHSIPCTLACPSSILFEISQFQMPKSRNPKCRRASDTRSVRFALTGTG